MSHHKWHHNTQVDLPDAPKAVMVVVHGYGEHLGRYDQFTERALAQGYGVARANLPGHGQGSALTADITDFSDYVDTLAQRVAEVRANLPNTPIVVFGHSLGSHIVAWYASQRPADIAGFVFSGGLVAATGVPKIKIWATKLLGGLLPSLTTSLNFDADAISSIPAENARYTNDPLVFDRATLQWGRAMMTALQQFGDQPRWPTRSLWLHGGNDAVNPLAPVQCYVAEQPNWQLCVFEGDHHEVHHDIHAEQFYRNLFDWLS